MGGGLRSDQVLIRDKFVAVLLKDDAGEGSPANNHDLLVVLLEFLDECQEVAITAYDHKCVDVIPGKRHFQRVQRKVDIRAVLVSAWSQITLNHLNGVLSHASTVLASAFPVAVGNLRHDFAAFFDGFQHGSDVEMTIQGAFDSDLDIVEIDEYCNLKTISVQIK